MAIQSLGSAAISRPPLPDRASGSPSVVGNGGNTTPQIVALKGSQNTQDAQATSVDTSNAVKKPDEIPSVEQLNQAVQNINKSLQSLNQNLEFSVDSDSKRTIVKVVDQKTKEVIRQIPSKETLEIAKALDTVKGLLIKQQA